MPVCACLRLSVSTVPSEKDKRREEKSRGNLAFSQEKNKKRCAGNGGQARQGRTQGISYRNRDTDKQERNRDTTLSVLLLCSAWPGLTQLAKLASTRWK